MDTYDDDVTFSAEYMQFIMPDAEQLKMERRAEDYAKAHNISFIEAWRELYDEG